MSVSEIPRSVGTLAAAVGLDHHSRMDPVPVDKVQPRDDDYRQDRTGQQFASAHGVEPAGRQGRVEQASLRSQNFQVDSSPYPLP